MSHLQPWWQPTASAAIWAARYLLLFPALPFSSSQRMPAEEWFTRLSVSPQTRL